VTQVHPVVGSQQQCRNEMEIMMLAILEHVPVNLYRNPVNQYKTEAMTLATADRALVNLQRNPANRCKTEAMRIPEHGPQLLQLKDRVPPIREVLLFQEAGHPKELVAQVVAQKDQEHDNSSNL